ncbi:MAG: phosphatidylglycerophosphatase A family protein, partial [Gammaproteobacteria bacterium]
LITMAVMPHALLERGGWLWILLGFVLFRAFDILKPWPIRWFDRNVGGGIGIMLDDLVAAIPSAVVLYILRLALPAW